MELGEKAVWKIGGATEKRQEEDAAESGGEFKEGEVTDYLSLGVDEESRRVEITTDAKESS
ncbi:S-acyltransferase protein [Corchorus olitorius]|uniref:S-acyltransferase protein n=1 Tax=Corchorus olitorius TaxID=93759 RepID=A0A1R3J7K5_9ROSI|nr:S-acyltransferase protein [Corchorus olitorius]